jgi:hypothetical protein
MKKLNAYKLAIIFLIVGNNLFSQANVYKPFPQLYGRWLVHSNGPLGPFTGAVNSWKEYIASGDTLVGSYTYKKVTVASNTGYPTWNGTTYVIPFGPATFSFGYRNDAANKKVYYLDVTGGANTDTLWYDFNLNIGDTLKDTYAFTNPQGMAFNTRRIVQSFDSVLICGSYYKKINFVCANPFDTDLIEGVGFVDRFFQTNYVDCPFEPTYMYDTQFSICNITSVYEAGKNGKNEFQISPNPVVSELQINSPAPFVSYKIFDAFGKLVEKGSNTKEPVNVSQLGAGIYIIEIQDKQGRTQQSKFIKQ